MCQETEGVRTAFCKNLKVKKKTKTWHSQVVFAGATPRPGILKEMRKKVINTM